MWKINKQSLCFSAHDSTRGGQLHRPGHEDDRRHSRRAVNCAWRIFFCMMFWCCAVVMFWYSKRPFFMVHWPSGTVKTTYLPASAPKKNTYHKGWYPCLVHTPECLSLRPQKGGRKSADHLTICTQIIRTQFTTSKIVLRRSRRVNMFLIFFQQWKPTKAT